MNSQRLLYSLNPANRYPHRNSSSCSSRVSKGGVTFLSRHASFALPWNWMAITLCGPDKIDKC